MATTTSGQRLVAGEAVGFRLYDVSLNEVRQSLLAAGHGGYEGLGVLQGRPQAHADIARVDRHVSLQVRVIVGAIPRVATDLSDQAFRREPWILRDGRPDDGAERQMMLVDMKEIEDVAGLATTGGGQGLVGREVEDMQSVSK